MNQFSKRFSNKFRWNSRGNLYLANQFRKNGPLGGSLDAERNQIAKGILKIRTTRGILRKKNYEAIFQDL